MSKEEILKKHNDIMLRLFNFNGNRIAPTREDIIRSEISKKYRIEDEIALINNYNLYLNDNTLTRYKTEYEDYLKYREEIKNKTNTIYNK